MYFYPEASAQANIDCGFRTVLCGAVSADTEDWTQLERDYLRFSALHPLVSYRLGFHAEYTASVPLLETIASLARQYRAPVWTHNSETRAEVDECLGRHGKTPTALFDSLGLFDYGGGGYHCVHFSEADMAIFRERGLWAVTCPGSNAKLASGIAPVVRMQEAGVQLAIGTDGAASNNALDIFREMYLVSVLQKLREGDAAACSADSVLLMAAQGGARAMGLPDCDAIEAGQQADLVVLSLRNPNMHPFHNLTKNLVYSGSKQNVRLTMVAGRILFEDGAYFVGEDPERIAAEAERLAGEIVRGF
jgi:5-methylthioadenosine/S-adenosylhomocysteine deaminase